MTRAFEDRMNNPIAIMRYLSDRGVVKLSALLNNGLLSLATPDARVLVQLVRDGKVEITKARRGWSIQAVVKTKP